jgi:murein DD-endopeptidase MepM/ murein hydrolase activator NlpD
MARVSAWLKADIRRPPFLSNNLLSRDAGRHGAMDAFPDNSGKAGGEEKTMNPRRSILPRVAVLIAGMLALAAVAIAHARHLPVTLKALDENYLVAEQGGGGIVNANRRQAREWESFMLLDLKDGELRHGDAVAIRSKTGHFISAVNGGGDKVLADKTAPLEWETFTIEKTGVRPGQETIRVGDHVYFRTVKNFYLVAENGKVHAKSTSTSYNARFRLGPAPLPLDMRLSGPFTAPRMILRVVVGTDDLARASGDIKHCKNGFFGENFPNCYRGHEGTDFGLVGHGLAQMAGSIDIHTVAPGKVVAVADGNPDYCYFKLPPPPPDSKAEDFVFCFNDPGGARTANFVAVLQDDGVLAYYYHLKRDSVLVRPGNRVACGQPIAKLGSSGISSVPHLHVTLQKIKAGATFPSDPEGFKSAGGKRDVADIINPYFPVSWIKLNGNIPIKTCGENRGAGEEGAACGDPTHCKLGLVCQNGACKKPGVSIPIRPPW